MRLTITVPELVEAMTGHERHLWARAGYPGGGLDRNRDVEKIKPFLCGNLERRLEAKRSQPGWRWSVQSILGRLLA